MEDHLFESAMEMIDGRDAEIERLRAALKPLAMYHLYGHDVSKEEWDQIPAVLGLPYDHRVALGVEQKEDRNA